MPSETLYSHMQIVNLIIWDIIALSSELLYISLIWDIPVGSRRQRWRLMHIKVEMTSADTPVPRELKERLERMRGLCAKVGVREVRPQLVAEAQAASQLLGKGASGSCYLVHDSDGSPLSVKILHADRPEKQWLPLFMEARQMVKAEKVSGVVRLVGVCLWPKAAIVTAYAGKTLTTLLEEGKLSRKNAISIITQVVRISRDLTDANHCHVDIDPDNIVVKQTGKRYEVTVIDLGMASKFGHNLHWDEKEPAVQHAPEIFEGADLSPATQAYQVGRLIKRVSDSVGSLDAVLLDMAMKAMGEAAHRPAVSRMYRRCKYLVFH